MPPPTTPGFLRAWRIPVACPTGLSAIRGLRGRARPTTRSAAANTVKTGPRPTLAARAPSTGPRRSPIIPAPTEPPTIVPVRPERAELVSQLSPAAHTNPPPNP